MLDRDSDRFIKLKYVRFVCKYCGGVFRTPLQLINHKKQHHLHAIELIRLKLRTATDSETASVVLKRLKNTTKTSAGSGVAYTSSHRIINNTGNTQPQASKNLPVLRVLPRPRHKIQSPFTQENVSFNSQETDSSTTGTSSVSGTGTDTECETAEPEDEYIATATVAPSTAAAATSLFCDDNPVEGTDSDSADELFSNTNNSDGIPFALSTKCRICSSIFPRISDRVIHERTHTDIDTRNHEEKPYVCPRCSRSYVLKGSLTRHSKTCTGNAKRRPRNFSHLWTHIGQISRTQARRFRCSFRFCQQTFSAKRNLQSHERRHAGEYRYKCQECGKSFRSRRTLRYHSIKGKNSCNRNGASSSLSSSILSTPTTPSITKQQQDLGSFQDSKFFKKPTYNTVETNSSQEINTMSTTPPTRRSTEQVPQNRFKHRRRMKMTAHSQHITRQMIRGTQVNSCNFCHRKFELFYRAKLHVMTHTGEKPFTCSMCKQTFSLRRLLRQHEITHASKKKRTTV